MYKQFVRGSLGFLVIILAIPSCEGLSGEYNDKYLSIGYYKENGQIKSLLAPDLNELLEPRRGLGISAWGIVAIVVSFFLAVVGMYFISICYPVICQKNRKCIGSEKC